MRLRKALALQDRGPAMSLAEKACSNVSAYRATGQLDWGVRAPAPAAGCTGDNECSQDLLKPFSRPITPR